MDSALAEFSRQGYGASSVNTICAAEDISKGIIYHYFETKDGLFLACVEECFQRLTAYIQENMPRPEDGENQLESYFAIRTKFFHAYPVYQRIFCDSVIAPPVHLREEIQKRKEGFDSLNVQILEQLLAPYSLRSSISKEEIIETFRQFQDFINIYYQTSDTGDQVFERREERCRRALNIFLYGVIERK